MENLSTRLLLPLAMTATDGLPSWICPACAARNAPTTQTCLSCGTPRSATGADDDVMADLVGADLLRGAPAPRAASATQPGAPPGPAPTPLGSAAIVPRAVATAAPAGASRGSHHDIPAGATMQLPSIEDLRATGTTAAAPSAVPAPDATAEYPAQRTPGPGRRWTPPAQLLRALPLALLCAAAAGALMMVAMGNRSGEVAGAPAAPPSAGAAPTTLILPAVDATIGLTEDNKEAVLSLCFRASDNPNTECRRAYLEQLGEFPHHVVHFGPIEADVFEVANAWYDACVAAGECGVRDVANCQYFTVRRREIGRRVPESLLAPDRPAVCVTQAQAAQFCASRGMRLPTGPEWERLARAGAERLQPWGNFWTPAILNWGERDMVGFPVAGRLDGHELTAPVDAFFDGRTTEGLYQLFGNAAEWTAEEADGSGFGEVRGGSCVDDARVFRATRVTEVPVAEARSTVGFRCVADRP